MGFRPVSAPTQSASMLFVAYLPQVDINRANSVANVGVDAVLLPQEAFVAKELKQIVATLKDIPAGIWVKETNSENVIQIAKSGCDFVVFGLKTSIEVLKVKDIGKILEIRPSLDPGLVRAINDLPLSVDGVIIRGEESYLTVEYLLICQRFSELVTKPVLVTLPLSFSSEQLSSLREMGVDGVVVSGEQPEERLTELKKAISDLPRRIRQRGKVAAVLPPLSQETAVAVEEEEEI